MQADGLRGELVGGGWSPYLDGDVRGCGNEGIVVLGEDDVVDPVGVCLDLLAKLGRRRLEVGGVGVGKRVALVGVALVQVEVQVPGAYYAITAARVAVPCQSGW